MFPRTFYRHNINSNLFRPQAQNETSQQRQDTTSGVTMSSKNEKGAKRHLQENASSPHKIGRFELLPATLYQYTERYMTHHVPDKKIKERILRGTHMEKAPSNKITAFTKIMNIDIWVIGTLNQLLLRGSYIQVES